MQTVTITLTTTEENIMECHASGDLEDENGNLTQVGSAAAFMVTALSQMVKSVEFAEAAKESADVVH